MIYHAVSNLFQIILCHTSHLKHYYKMIYLNSYQQKTFSNIADDVKCGLNKFAHLNTKKEFSKVISDLKS